MNAFCLLAVLVAACDNGRAGEVTASGSYWEFDGHFGRPQSDYFVLIVDDLAGTEAELLREQVVRSLRHGLQDQIESLNAEYPDPASWHPIDLTVLVVRPSLKDDEALVTPAMVAELEWKSNQANEAEADAVARSVSLVLASTVVDASAQFRPLRAAKRTIQLLFGLRAAENEIESQLQLGLTDVPFVELLIASTRPTEDDGALSDYRLDHEPRPDGYAYARVIAPASDSESCRGYPSPIEDWSAPVTLENWAAASDSPLYFWPCSTAADTLGDIFSNCCVDFGPWWSMPRLLTLPSGQVECRTWVEQTEKEATGGECDAARGWRDASWLEREVDPDPARPLARVVKRCEIVQLEGAALDSCRTTLECQGCEPGFCATEVPELYPWPSSETPERFSPVRFIGGAFAGVGGRLRMRCLLDRRF